MSSPESPFSQQAEWQPQNDSEAITQTATAVRDICLSMAGELASVNSITQYQQLDGSYTLPPIDIGNFTMSCAAWRVADNNSLLPVGEMSIAHRTKNEDSTVRDVTFTYKDEEPTTVTIDAEDESGRTSHRYFEVAGDIVMDSTQLGSAYLKTGDTNNGIEFGVDSKEAEQLIRSSQDSTDTLASSTDLIPIFQAINNDLFSIAHSSVAELQPEGPAHVYQLGHVASGYLEGAGVSHGTILSDNLSFAHHTEKQVDGIVSSLVMQCLSPDAVMMAWAYAQKFGETAEVGAAAGQLFGAMLGKNVRIHTHDWSYTEEGALLPNGPYSIIYTLPGDGTMVRINIGKHGEMTTCLLDSSPNSQTQNLRRISVEREDDGTLFTYHYQPQNQRNDNSYLGDMPDETAIRSLPDAVEYYLEQMSEGNAYEDGNKRLLDALEQMQQELEALEPGAYRLLSTVIESEHAAPTDIISKETAHRASLQISNLFPKTEEERKKARGFTFGETLSRAFYDRNNTSTISVQCTFDKNLQPLAYSLTLTEKPQADELRTTEYRFPAQGGEAPSVHTQTTLQWPDGSITMVHEGEYDLTNADVATLVTLFSEVRQLLAS